MERTLKWLPQEEIASFNYEGIEGFLLELQLSSTKPPPRRNSRPRNTSGQAAVVALMAVLTQWWRSSDVSSRALRHTSAVRWSLAHFWLWHLVPLRWSSRSSSECLFSVWCRLLALLYLGKISRCTLSKIQSEIPSYSSNLIRLSSHAEHPEDTVFSKRFLSEQDEGTVSKDGYHRKYGSLVPILDYQNLCWLISSLFFFSENVKLHAWVYYPNPTLHPNPTTV